MASEVSWGSVYELGRQLLQLQADDEHMQQMHAPAEALLQQLKDLQDVPGDAQELQTVLDVIAMYSGRVFSAFSHHAHKARGAAADSIDGRERSSSSSSSKKGKKGSSSKKGKKGSGGKKGRPLACHGSAASVSTAELLAANLQAMDLLAQQLFAASLLRYSMPAAAALVPKPVFTWTASGALAACSSADDKLKEAALAAAGHLQLPVSRALGKLASYSTKAAEENATVQQLVQCCSGMAQHAQQQVQQQDIPGPSSALPKLAAAAARGPSNSRPQDYVQQMKQHVTDYTTKYNAQYSILSYTQWMCLMQHNLVVDWHSNHLCPVYRAARVTSSSSSSSKRPDGVLCPMVTCGCCKEVLPSSHSIILHECRKGKGKVLQLDELASLAAAADCDPLCDGRQCFLCGGDVNEEGAHTCECILWNCMVVDQTQMPHANPAEEPRVLLQTDLVKVRQCHGIVQVVFMTPEEYLPTASLSAAADDDDEEEEEGSAAAGSSAVRLLRDGTWPLLRFLMVAGASSFVEGQLGGFALLPPFHSQEELVIQPDRKSYKLSDAMQKQLHEQYLQRSSSHSSSSRFTAEFVPCLTRSMAGFYTGALLFAPPEDDDNLAVTGMEWEGDVYCFIDPRGQGSFHVLFNQAHDTFAVLEPRHMTFPRIDGTRTPPQMLLEAEQKQTILQQQPAMLLQGGGLVELTWWYRASTTDFNDPLRKVICMCAWCKKRKVRAPLVKYEKPAAVQRVGVRQSARQAAERKRPAAQPAGSQRKQRQRSSD